MAVVALGAMSARVVAQASTQRTSPGLSLGADAGLRRIEPPTHVAVLDVTRPDAVSDARSATVSAAPGAPREAVVVWGGDLVPHQDVLRSFAAKGGASLYAPIVAALRAADLAMLNFETPAAPSRPIPTSQMQFNVHADFVRALSQAGIDAVSVANNHGYDAGIDAVGETVRTLREAGIVPVGGALQDEDPLEPSRFTLLGETLCVMAATRLLNFDMVVPTAGRPRLGIARESQRAERDAFVDAVRRAKGNRCAAVLVSLHSGTEYTDEPESRDRTFFRRCADAGADVVIGHHSHTPHPVEMHRVSGSSRVVPIFYSLGNFLSNQGAAAEAGVRSAAGTHNVNFDARTRESILAVLRFRRARAGMLEVSRAGWVPLWTINAPLRRRAGEAQTIQAALMPRDGADDPLLRGRWSGVARRVGRDSLLAREDVPGWQEAYEASDLAVSASRAEARRPAESSRTARSSSGGR